MPALPVTVQITGTGAGSAYTEQLVQACNEVARERGCRLGSESTEPEGNLVAVVEWDANRRRAFIRIAARDESGRTLERRLEFDEDDREAERWRSVGITIAIMAGSFEEQPSTHGSIGEVREHEPPAARDDRTRAARPKETRKRAPAVAPKTILWLDGAALTGPGLDEGPWRWGGQARAWYRPWQSPVLVLGTVAHAVHRTNDVGVAWTTSGLGVGYSIDPFVPTELRVHVAVLGELVTADVVDASSGESDDDQAFDFGLGFGADFAWNVTSWLGLIVGGDIGSTAKAVDIRVRDAPTGHGGAVSYTVFAGARLSLVKGP